MEYSSNSYFATTKQEKQNSNQEEGKTISSTPVQLAKIDPNVKYDKFIRTNQTGDKVYFVENTNAHWIKNPETLAALGGDFGKVVSVPYEVLKTLNQRCVPIDMRNVADYAPKVEEKTATEVNGVSEENIEKIQEVIKDFPQTSQTKEVTREKGVFSYIVILSGDDFLMKNLFELKENIIAFKELVKTIPHEIVLVANGTTMSPQASEFNFAERIVILDKQIDFQEALFKGVRVSKGEYPLLLC